MDNPGATPLFPHEEGKDSIAEEEDASPVVEWKDDQRWPLPHEPQCLICQRYGTHPLSTTVFFPLFIYFVLCQGPIFVMRQTKMCAQWSASASSCYGGKINARRGSKPKMQDNIKWTHHSSQSQPQLCVRGATNICCRYQKLSSFLLSPFLPLFSVLCRT